MDKKSLSERDICKKFITPALRWSGWDEIIQVREEVSFTKGRITVRGKLVSQGKGQCADYILYYKPNIPIAVIEAKDNNHAIGDGVWNLVIGTTQSGLPEGRLLGALAGICFYANPKKGCIIAHGTKSITKIAANHIEKEALHYHGKA